MKSVTQALEARQKAGGVWLKCPHSECGNRIWKYKGNMRVYAVCPDCKSPIRIDQNQIQEPKV